MITYLAVVSTDNGMFVASASATSVWPSQAAQCTGINLFESSATMLYGCVFIWVEGKEREGMKERILESTQE